METRTFLSSLFLLLAVILGQRALSENTYIHNANELTNFSKSVNSGKDYFGTTVFLDADIDFSGGLSEQFESIGNRYGAFFMGDLMDRGTLLVVLQ